MPVARVPASGRMLVDGAVRTELPNATTADYSESMQRFVPFGAPRHVGPFSGDGRAALARLPGHLWGSGAIPVLLGLLARDDGRIGTVCAPMGVEEEYFLVDPHTRTPEPAGARVARLASETLGDLVCGEFTQDQIEVKTPPCADAAQLREQLLRLRTSRPQPRRPKGCGSARRARRSSPPAHPRPSGTIRATVPASNSTAGCWRISRSAPCMFTSTYLMLKWPRWSATTSDLGCRCWWR